MRCCILLMLLWLLGLASCQKQLHELIPPVLNDSSNAAKPGQLIGMKIYYLNGTDTVPTDYYQFAYDSNPKRLIEYHHLADSSGISFSLDMDTANKIWTYDNNNLLVTQAGFYKGINNITYINNINRDAAGQLESFVYQNAYYKPDCSTYQYDIVTESATGIFNTLPGALKAIRYVDTLSGADDWGNKETDYTVYFDAAGRVQTKVLNGFRLKDGPGCHTLNYYPVNDTVKQLLYDPATGKLLKSIITYYQGAVGSTPADLEKTTYTCTYTYDARDNQKISRFFQEYTWGKDLQSWFTYRPQTIGSAGGGVDDDYFQPEFEHLKFGVCEKMTYTIESFLHNVSEGKYTLACVVNSTFNTKGDITGYSISNPAYSSYFQFIYR